MFCHGTHLRNWTKIWKYGIKGGGPNAKRNENFFKLPDDFQTTQWGQYGEWEPSVYKFDRDCLVHADTEAAMTTGCPFYTDATVGAILSSNATVPPFAILKITTKRGETLAFNKTAQDHFQ